MKKALLIIMILSFVGLSPEMMAQRKRNEDRRPGREEAFRNKRDGRKKQKQERFRGQRTQRVVDRRVYRNTGWRNHGYSDTYGYPSRVYYDYDFRRGRRVVVDRSYRPSRRHIWVAGHWRYSPRLDRDVWVNGRWMVRRANHRWVPGRYERFNGSRVWVDGCWTILY